MAEGNPQEALVDLHQVLSTRQTEKGAELLITGMCLQAPGSDTANRRDGAGAQQKVWVIYKEVFSKYTSYYSTAFS